MILELREFTAGYGDINVIHNLNIGLESGEVLALIGHNGAGKTTTLLSIMGDVKSRKGKIFYKGEDVTGQRTSQISKKGIAFVPQNENVFPSLSVEENLFMGIHMGQGHARHKIGKENMAFIFELFPILAEKRSHRASSLSGGQRQMLAIGMAIISKPDVLLLDEPSTGLAPVLVEKVLNVVRDISKNLGLAVLIVEQNVGQVLRIADRANVIKLGSTVYEGKADKVSVKDLWEMF